MIEPFMARRGADGRLRTELTTEAAVRASVIAAGLGTTSAHTWLKVPVVDDMERVVGRDHAAHACCSAARSQTTRTRPSSAGDARSQVPGAIGLVVGRSLLYPPDDDVAAAVDTAVSLLPRAVTA